MSAKRPDVPSCLFLDVRVPGLSGLDLRREVANMDPAIAIVMIGGHAEMPMTVQAVKAGAVEFLARPFREQQVLDAVQQAIERNRAARQQRAELVEWRRRYEPLTQREREIMT
jgi:FixJ family two-component response regulator